MTVKIKPGKHTDQVLDDLAGHLPEFKKGITEALHYVGAIAVNETKRLIREPPKTGITYPRPGGRRHQASAPGEAPANDTGALQDSVDYVVTGVTQLEFGDRIIYGKWLEKGTRDKRILPRPHVLRAANTVSRQATRALGSKVAKRLKIR